MEIKDYLNSHPIFYFLVKNNLVTKYWLSKRQFENAPSFYGLDISSYFSPRAFAHGFKKDAKEAVDQALYEFLERYPLALGTLIKKENLIKASVKEIQRRSKIPDLTLFSGFNDEQKEKFPYRKWNEDSLFYWQKVERWLTKEKLYLPAQYIYWNYKFDENEPYLRESNTSASGGFWDKEGAILAGLYELIQRDSFLIYWLNSLAPKQIDPYTIPDIKFQKLFLETIDFGYQVYILDVTTETQIPAFVAIIHNPNQDGPCYVLGGGCNLDPLKAIYRAFDEAWSIYYWVKRLAPYVELDKNYTPFYETYIDQRYRLRLWANHKMKENLEFFLKGEKLPFYQAYPDELKIFDSNKEELDFVVKKIESLGEGYEVYYYLHELKLFKRLSYFSAKVIVPKLINIYFWEPNIPLNSPRIYESPPKFGYQPSSKINPLPHLFP